MYIYIYIYIYIYNALCIAHCSQFEHSGDSTLQSSQCVTVHPVPKFRSCHKAIMVITVRAHCYTFCIFRSLLMQFEHSRSWIGWRVSIRRSLFALCIAHCSQFEHSGDSTLQSSQCVTVHPVPKFRSCHKAIMVITVRAHCYTFCIFRSLLMQFEHSRSWIGWRVSIRRSLFALCIAHCSQFEHSGDSTLQSSQCVTVHPVPKFRSCHKAIMVITVRAHCYTFCYTFCIYIYIYMKI